MRRTLRLALLLLLGAALPCRADDVTVSPPSLRLSGPGAGYSLLVDGKGADGRLVDLTHEAHFRSLKPQVAAVTAAGFVQGKSDGATEVLVEVKGKTLRVPVRVEGSARPRALHFENDIEPLLSRFGCNSSGCHGSAQGQNGFKLSVFGFDPAADHAALVKESRGRRILPAARLYAEIDRIHHRIGEPHWYLAVLGCDPGWQGRGVGASLLAPVLERIDRSGESAYLETQKEDNVPWYRRHGFEVVEEIRARGCPTMWAMHKGMTG